MGERPTRLKAVLFDFKRQDCEYKPLALLIANRIGVIMDVTGSHVTSCART
jgi:hypothetical protein